MTARLRGHCYIRVNSSTSCSNSVSAPCLAGGTIDEDDKDPASWGPDVIDIVRGPIVATGVHFVASGSGFEADPAGWALTKARG